MTDGSKLVGSAQCRLEGMILQHGSILIEDGQGIIDELRRRDPDPENAPATLTDALGTAPEPEAIIEAVITEFRSEFPGEWPENKCFAVTTPADDLVDHYRSQEWTWRR